MKKKILIIFFLFFSNYLISQQYIPGKTYFGEKKYIEYQPGNLPIIISAPHGGNIKPDDIPDRNCSGCVYIQDAYTQNLIRQMKDAIYDEFGCYPHIIINRLHRVKLDANRDIGEAADSNSQAEQAWKEYHDFIQTAKDTVMKYFGKGLYIDLHGHGHSIQRLELGYLLSKQDLQLPDSALNENKYHKKSSIKNLSFNNKSNSDLADLIRGEFSFGELFERESIPAVPSQTQAFPNDNEKYFSGGYNTWRHGSRDGGTIDGIQIECNRKGIRDSYDNREKFSKAAAIVIEKYLEKHYFGEGFMDSVCFMVSDIDKDVIIEPSIKIFPNPANNHLNIEINNSMTGHYSVSMFNELGQIVYSDDFENETKIILIKKFPTGIYFLKIKSPEINKILIFVKR